MSRILTQSSYSFHPKLSRITGTSALYSLPSSTLILHYRFAQSHNSKPARSGRTYATLIDPSSVPMNVKPDVLIVGSGGAGLVAALRAKSLNLKPLVIEKSKLIGGSACYSGGGLWIPNNGISPGARDSVDDALLYMESLISPNYTGPASTRERKLAFLNNGPKMLRFLADQGFRWRASEGYPDYYPNVAGGRAGGRSVEGDMFNVNKLGAWKKKLNFNPIMPATNVPMFTFEAKKLFRLGSGWEGLIKAMQIIVWRNFANGILGRKPITMGASLIGQLLYLNLKNEIPIWTETSLKELVVKDDKVIGVVLIKDGKETIIEAPKGVFLCAGGFAQNKEMRQKYQEAPIGNEWTSTSPCDHGDAINAALQVGAATELLDDSWWGPTMIDPSNGMPMWCQFERGLPHSIVVDKAGNRFTNEAQSYTTFGHDQYKRNRTTSAIPAFLILDQQHRSKYMLAAMTPGKLPKKALDSGYVVKADTLDELAQKLGIDVEGLKKTVQRFNSFVAKGVDEDYNRGGNAYDIFFGDPASKYRKNPTIGTIEKPPFYAAKLFPGDLGTKGGLLTDTHSRVLKKDGSVIPNLYAFGNTSASVMGKEYCGAGSTLGPALTFAYIAANHVGGSR